MKLAIILVNFNGIKDTLECIDSIYQDESSLEKKIIVVDNGNQEQGFKIKNKYPQVEIIRTDNHGFSAANNVGMKKAFENGFDKVLLLNNDTIVEKDFFEIIMKDYDGKEIICPKILYYSQPDTIWYGGGHINKFTGMAYHDQLNQKDENISNNVIDCTFATGCCLLLSKQIIDQIGYLDESFFMYCEDVEFCIRCLENNIPVKYNPNARIYHKISASTGKAYSPFSTYYLTRNRLAYIRAHRAYFSRFALGFSILSRYVKIIQCTLKKDINAQAYQDGMNDYRNHIIGRNSKY